MAVFDSGEVAAEGHRQAVERIIPSAAKLSVHKVCLLNMMASRFA
jgi:hypothetical protein